MKNNLKNNLKNQGKEQNNQDNDRFGLVMFCVSLLCLFFAYGVAVGRYKIFPHRYLNKIIAPAEKGFQELNKETNPEASWYFKRLEAPYPKAVLNTSEAYPGLNLVSSFSYNKAKLSMELLDMDGNKLHEWDVDWKRIFPDIQHVPEQFVPKSRPGTSIHGMVMLDNGNIIFNIMGMGLVCLAPDGEVVWKLPNLTHHSIHVHDDGNLWVSDMKVYEKPSEELKARFPNRKFPIWEYTIIEVSPDGRILNEWSIDEILRKNGYEGLLTLGTIDNRKTTLGSDILHANDVEPFPSNMKEGFFKKGDIMVSPRNINTVFVFNKDTEEIKFFSTGLFVRQHDPDFIDGNTFSVFDNNNSAPESAGVQSRILIISAPDNKAEVFYEGTKENPFFTDIGGKHQWLPNGNLLITDFVNGRGFEVNPQGEIVWEYYNYVEDGVVGVINEVQRLPLEYEKIFRKDK